MSDNDSTVEELEQDGEKEVFELLKPHLMEPGSEGEKLLKERLVYLGVSNLGQVSILQENDFPNIITPIQIRQMLIKFKSNNSGSSKSNESSSSGKSNTYKLNVKSLVSAGFFEMLERDSEILEKSERRKLVVALAEDIKDNVVVVRRKDVLAVSVAVTKAYPTSIGCLMKDDADIKEAALALCNSIQSHIAYVSSQKKAKRLSGGESGPAKRLCFSKSQNSGLNAERDVPDLPDGETLETQEAKRLLMVEMETSGTPLNWTVIKKLMAETYCRQRADINDQLSMEKLLAKWPFIGKHSILQSHFENLKDIKVAEVMQGCETFFPNLEKFFEAETHKKRKGKCANVPKRLKEILLKYQQQHDENQDSKHYIAIILCALAYMDVPLNGMFLLFEETTSFNEVQAFKDLPSHPIIAVLGDNPQENPPAYVLVDKRIISEVPVSVSKAINILLMSYFIFKIAYPTESAPILHFLQRKVFNITDEGTRTERKKSRKGYTGAPPDIPNKLVTLMKHFKDYCSEWNLDSSM